MSGWRIRKVTSQPPAGGFLAVALKKWSIMARRPVPSQVWIQEFPDRIEIRFELPESESV